MPLPNRTRPGAARSIGDHETRIRALERQRPIDNEWCIARTSGTDVVPGDNSLHDLNLSLAIGSGIDTGLYTHYAGFVDMVQIEEEGTYEVRWTTTQTGTWTPAAGQHIDAFAYILNGVATSHFGFGAEGMVGSLTPDPVTGRLPAFLATGGFLHWPTNNPLREFLPSQIAVQARQNTGSNLTITVEVYIKRVDFYLADPAVVLGSQL